MTLKDIISRLSEDLSAENRDAICQLLEEHEAAQLENKAANARLEQSRRKLTRAFSRCRKDDCEILYCPAVTRDKCLYRQIEKEIHKEVERSLRKTETS